VNDLYQELQNSAFGLGFFFVFGLIWGSFFNVCIARMPADESVVKGRSHCPKCQTQLPWYLNIPLLSYLYLRGRCHHCKTRISIQYPLVELITGFLFAGLYYRYGVSVQWLAYAVYLSALLIITVIDLYHQIIPNELSLPGIVVGFLFCLLTGDILWWESLLGVLLGGGLFFLIAFIYEKWSGREGLGGGDVKLLAMMGAWQGYQSILLIIVLSSAIGSIVGIGLMIAQGKNLKTAIPFGPFLALAAALCLFWGPQLQAILFPAQ
jgi:leader peptidase (prepilin peptidase) / N-methyltransferase